MIYLIVKKIKTKDINTSINKLALENSCSTSEFSYVINGIDTFIKSVADDNFMPYNEDTQNYYVDYDKLINSHARFRQIYTITIKQTPKKAVVLDYNIVFSQNNSTVTIILNPDSQIPYKKYQPKEIYLLLLREFNNIKAQNNILVNMFDSKMRKQLKQFVSYLYKDRFIKNIKLILFEGINPEITRNSKLIMHFLQKEKNHQVIEVTEGEVLVEFIKPIFGKNGLNAFGEIIDNIYYSNKSDLKCKVDSKSIEIIEDNNKKIYKSKSKGYVHFDEKDFYVDNRIKMQHLSRVQNSVAKDESNNIEVIISQNDTSLDSLGEGVELTSETIHINGHVGAKSSLKAVNLTIDGATHKDSSQEVKFATINRHKGKLRCHSAKIRLLEGGEVHATNVEIQDSIGGTVYAENVTIGHVKNNLKVYASKSIMIRHVSGENNLFKINHKEIPTLNSRYDFLTKEIDDLKYKLDGAKKHTPSEVSKLQEYINRLKIEQKEIIDGVKYAKIEIKEAFEGLNTVTFTLNDDQELTYKTDAKKYEQFYIIETKNYIKLHPTAKKISIDI